MKVSNVLKKDCVAKFYYKGNHSHPVRREVLVVNDSLNFLVGYELREGKEVRLSSKAPLKSYSKKKIAKYGSYSRLRASKATRRMPKNLSTLKFCSLESIFG
jgi:hypothetical protein